MRNTLIIIFSLLSWQAVAETHNFTLPNGLKVIVKEDHRAPVAVSMIWYNIGSSDEPGGITGVSHALEHMMFKGTQKYPLGVFSKTVAELGGQENAFTNYDYTAYYEQLSASQLPLSFELEADRMQNLILSDEEFKKEIQVIQEERRLRTDDNPQSLAFERYLAAAHLTDPYHHPVIGWMEDLKQMNVNDVKSWYNSFYAPNNAVLVVVGDVDADHVHKLASLYFGKIPRKPSFVRKNQIEPASLGAKSVEVYAPAHVPMEMFGFTVPSANSDKSSSDAYALEVIASLLSNGESSRLSKNIVRGKRIASAADVYYNLYSRYQTQFIFFAVPAQSFKIEDTKKAMLAEVKQLKSTLVSSDELNRVKTQLVSQKIYEQDSIFGQAMELGLLETVGLGWQAADRYKEKIEAITPQQIQDVATRYFNDSALTETRLFPLPKA